MTQSTASTTYGTAEIGDCSSSGVSSERRNWFRKDIGNVTNIVGIILTCNLLSFPWSFHKLGLCYGSIVLVASASVSCVTALSMCHLQQLVYKRTGIVANYCDTVQHFLGESMWLSSSIRVATAISCFGGCIGFYIFMGQILSQLLNETLRLANSLLFVPLFVISLSRNFRELSVFTAFSVVSFVLVIIVMYRFAFLSWFNGSPVHHDHSHASLHSAVELIGNSTFLFAIHYCLLSQEAENLEDAANCQIEKEAFLGSNKRKRIQWSTSSFHICLSFILSAIVSALFGLTGLLFAKGSPIIR